jgi:hypothetical protein
MKTTNILIPTDFSLASLQAIPCFDATASPAKKFNILRWLISWDCLTPSPIC